MDIELIYLVEKDSEDEDDDDEEEDENGGKQNFIFKQL